MALWDKWNTGHDLAKCNLYESSAGFLKLHIEDGGRRQNNFHSEPIPDWKLIKKGESAEGERVEIDFDMGCSVKASAYDSDDPEKGYTTTVY
ncbi:hypothetical protein HK101_005891 [Irineochytrium annulatum]|nr:hypothetical protein HK101_005891 [Irineochytrium annulatum]